MFRLARRMRHGNRLGCHAQPLGGASETRAPFDPGTAFSAKQPCKMSMPVRMKMLDQEAGHRLIVQQNAVLLCCRQGAVDQHHRTIERQAARHFNPLARWREDDSGHPLLLHQLEILGLLRRVLIGVANDDA